MAALVEMERDFVTAAFFRHAIAQRSLHMQQLEQMHDIMDSEPLRLIAFPTAHVGHFALLSTVPTRGRSVSGSSYQRLSVTLLSASVVYKSPPPAVLRRVGKPCSSFMSF